MTQKEKELLLKDLSARLPYMPKIRIIYQQQGIEGIDEGEVSYDVIEFIVNNLRNGVITDMQIYLRPMSSMTEKEIKELKTLCSIYIPTDSPVIGFEEYGIVVFTHHLTNNTYSFKLNSSVIDWLNKNMFAYRTIDGKDMFELGLAIKVPDDMYKI